MAYGWNYGWNTQKLDDGSYRWSVYVVEYQKAVAILVEGRASTRARAAGAARRQVLRYRRLYPMPEGGMTALAGLRVP